MENQIILAPSEDVVKGERIKALQDQLADFQKKVNRLEVKTDVTERNAGDIRVRLKEVQKGIKKWMDDELGPAKKWVKSIQTRVKEFQTKIDDMDRDLNRKMIEYHDLKEREAEEARRKAEEERKKAEEAEIQKAEKEGREAVIPEPAPIVPEVKTSTHGKEGSVTYMKRWAFLIENSSEVPREYCMVDERLIRQAVKDGIRTIPGVKIFEEKVTRRN